jgi:hypothetical protein
LKQDECYNGVTKRAPSINAKRRAWVAKDKKSKKKAKAAPAKAAQKLKSVALNPMVQEVVAAALVATAAALKDSRKARAMAEQAGDQIEKLAGEGAQKGKALWALALDVAKRAGDIVQDGAKAAKPAKPARNTAKPTKPSKPARPAKKKSAAKKAQK